MRILSRLLVILVAFALTVGPVSAAPLSMTHGAALSAPTSGPLALRSLLGSLAGALVVFGAIRIKDTASLSQKFVTRAGAAAGDYKDGVQAAGQDWQTNTMNSEGNYEQGVQQSIADKRFGKGVSAAGAQKYTTNAVALGSQRYAPGVQNAKDAWAKGVQSSLDTLKGMTLPPRGPRRSPQNQARANAVAVALGALKTGK